MIVLIGVVVLMSIYLSAVPKYTVYYIIYIQIIIETIMSYSRVAAIRSPVKRVGLHYRPPFFYKFLLDLNTHIQSQANKNGRGA